MVPGGWEQAGSKVRVRGMQEAERRLFPSFLWPLTPGATLFCQILKYRGSLLFSPPQTERLRDKQRCRRGQ